MRTGKSLHDIDINEIHNTDFTELFPQDNTGSIVEVDLDEETCTPHPYDQDDDDKDPYGFGIVGMCLTLTLILLGIYWHTMSFTARYLSQASPRIDGNHFYSKIYTRVALH